MAIEQTLTLVKPDGVRMGAADEICQRWEEAGFRIVWKKELQFTEEQAEAFYIGHKGKFYVHGLILAMISGPSLAVYLEGENAIEEVRKLNGATIPAEAEEGTIRHDFRSAGGPFNTVHSSDGADAVTYEVSVVTRRFY